MKEKNVLDFMLICNKLKNTIRTGWKVWNVKKDRIESVAEHIYGTQMLALSMYSEFNYDIDIMKVLYMLAVHELGECVIGDLVFYEISREDKIKIEHEAVSKILSPLKLGNEINEMFIEFDKRMSKEAYFAYQCDKLECDIQCKFYDIEGTVDLKDEVTKKAIVNEDIEHLIEQGGTWSDVWLNYDIKHINYDENFRSVIEYMLNNKEL